MTNYFVNTDTTSATDAFTLQGGDTLLLEAGTTIFSSGDNFAGIRATAVGINNRFQMVIDGTVGGYTGIKSGHDGSTTYLTIGDTGHVTSYFHSSIDVVGGLVGMNRGEIDNVWGWDGLRITANGISGGDVSFENFGSITTGYELGYAVNITESASGTYRFHNAGVLSVPVASNSIAYNGGVGIDFLTNTGEIHGGVSLGGNDDIFDGRLGTITGAVIGTIGGVIDGGSGNDSLMGGISDEDIRGGSGNDTIVGGDGRDGLSGGLDNDSVRWSLEDASVDGGSGNDIAYNDNPLYGAAGGFDIAARNFETYVGSAASEAASSSSNSVGGTFYMSGGDDYVFGGNGGDAINGDEGADTLIGNGGNDTINGGIGNDHVEGQLGSDVLSGGLGFDSFFYRGTFDGGDTINDFQIGFDKIVIQRTGFIDPRQMNAGSLDPNRFVAGPATLATGQFLFDTNQGFLYWDANGTGAGGVTLLAQLVGVQTLSAADFTIV